MRAKFRFAAVLTDVINGCKSFADRLSQELSEPEEETLHPFLKAVIASEMPSIDAMKPRSEEPLHPYLKAVLASAIRGLDRK